MYEGDSSTLIWGKVMAASGGAGTNCVWKDAVGSKTIAH